MRKFGLWKFFPLIVFLTTLTTPALTAAAQKQSEPRTEEALYREVRHKLVMLPYFSVFDNLAYSVDGGTVTLLGQVERASLKGDAEAVVKHVAGVEKLVNNIEVLPASINDDRLRRAEFRSIYRFSPLERYARQAVPPIHIIVKNGNVTLVGVTATEADKNAAGIRANSVAGVFSVKNELQVENAKK
jgi:hyperosmotically inducible periplasmic protein